MAKLTLTDVANLTNEASAVATLAANNDATEAAFENTLSRDGTSPNQMEASLDMNSHRILNLPKPSNVNEPARLQDLNDASAAAVITKDTSQIFGGTDGAILFDNNGVLGEKSTTGTGNVVQATSPTIATPTINTPVIDAPEITGTVTGTGSIPHTMITGLGTAAVENVGVAAGDLVQLDGSGKLPAVDGSQLTGLVLSDFYIPEDYGAVGNGVTDDRAAIQSCLNAAATAGKPVLFAAKTYAIDATTTGVVMDATTGCPPMILFSGTTWKQTAGTNKAFTISNVQNAATYKGFETIGRLIIDANNLAPNGLYVHGLQASSDGVLPVISGISVKTATSIGINVIGEPGYGVYGVHFLHLSALNCGAQGYQFSSINNGTDYYVQAILCSNLFATGCVGGMYVDYGGGTFSNIWMETNSGVGVTLNHTQDIVFLGGHCEANMLAGTDTPFQGTVSVSKGVKIFGTRVTGGLYNLYGQTGSTLVPCSIGYTFSGSSDAAGFDILRPNQIAFGSATAAGGNSINVPSTVANYIEFLVDNAGTAQFKGDSSLFNGNTSLCLTYHNGSVQRLINVTLGAADSGGTGYKVLRVPN